MGGLWSVVATISINPIFYMGEVKEQLLQEKSEIILGSHPLSIPGRGAFRKISPHDCLLYNQNKVVCKKLDIYPILAKWPVFLVQTQFFKAKYRKFLKFS